jgi:hypothetical protein
MDVLRTIRTAAWAADLAPRPTLTRETPVSGQMELVA